MTTFTRTLAAGLACSSHKPAIRTGGAYRDSFVRRLLMAFVRSLSVAAA